MYRPALKARVVLNTKTDQAFEGVLWKATRKYVVLKDAGVVTGDSRAPIAGDLIVQTSNIDFMVKQQEG